MRAMFVAAAAVGALSAAGCESTTTAECLADLARGAPAPTPHRAPGDATAYVEILGELQCARLVTCGLLWADDEAACRALNLGLGAGARKDRLLWTSVEFDPARVSAMTFDPALASACLDWLAQAPCLIGQPPPAACWLALVNTSACGGCEAGEVCESFRVSQGQQASRCFDAAQFAAQGRYWRDHGGTCESDSDGPVEPCAPVADTCASCDELPCGAGLQCGDGVCRPIARGARGAVCALFDQCGAGLTCVIDYPGANGFPEGRCEDLPRPGDPCTVGDVYFAQCAFNHACVAGRCT